jgi:hypothetical protein
MYHFLESISRNDDGYLLLCLCESSLSYIIHGCVVNKTYLIILVMSSRLYLIRNAIFILFIFFLLRDEHVSDAHTSIHV